MASQACMYLAAQLCAALLLPLAVASATLSQEGEPVIPKAPVPRLAATGQSAQDFAPRGWRVQLEQKGDLNGDGKPDLAFVLHQTSSRLIVHSKGFGVEDLDTNPRVLAVAFGQPDGSYALVAQNSTVIPRWTEANMDDYFGKEGTLTVARGAVTVGLHYFANMGGWDAGSTTLTFRWQHGRFELIGYDNDNTKRNTLEHTVTSVNYSTGVETVTTDAPDDSPVAVHRGIRRKKLPPRPLHTLDDVGDGLAFQAP